MTQQHTPGPWRTVPFICHGSRIGIQDADGKWVGEEGYQEVHHIPRFSPAHARRIVACLNACEGYETETLETVNLFESAYAAEGREFELTRQRVALLEALEKIIEMNRTTANDKFGDSEQAERWACVIVARAAIAKATGEAA